MKKQWRVGFGFLIITGGSVEAQTLSIDHQPVACAAAGKFPRLEARFAPAEAVAAARVVFQGQNPEWYSVAMKPEGASFTGVLPKPKGSLKAFRCYIEVTGKALGTNRTADYTTNVVDSASACKGKIMAATLGSASVVLQGPAGVAALPTGFASSGVVAAGSAAGSGSAVGAGAAGGIGATALVLGGLAAAGGAVAVVAGKGGGETASTSGNPPAPAPATTPTPAPTPTPPSGVACPACYAGQWRLQATLTFVANPSICGSKPGDLGKVETITPVTFNANGSMVFPPSAGTSGAVDALGNFRLDLAGDPPGSGLTCPAGQATGRCATVNSCSGTATQGGDNYTIVFDRQ